LDVPDIAKLSERFIASMKYHGVIEIEFKRDARDGQYKLLDVNARTWGFHSIGAASGVDFPYLVYADQMGLPIEPVHATSGVGWLRLASDIPTVFRDMAHGSLDFRTYLRSLKLTRVESVFSWHDPLPSLAEIFMLPYLAAKKYIRS
jgi:D-aspartate ligase